MARPRTYDQSIRVHVPMRLERGLTILFDDLCKKKGLSRNAGIMHQMMEAVKRGQIADYSYDVALEVKKKNEEWRLSQIGQQAQEKRPTFTGSSSKPVKRAATHKTPLKEEVKG